MNSALVTSLKEEFPKLFVKLECISCEDGWYNIIHSMCKKIQSYVDKEEDTQTRIFKIRNLYGHLQVNAFTDSIDAVERFIEEAEERASDTCEFTGLPGELYCKGSLYYTTTPEKARELNLTLCRLDRIPGL